MPPPPPSVQVDDCFFLHADMLHETPACPGIVHDPEQQTAYGTVYWAIDGRMGQLVRYDFQQPHGPGLMDHSVAAVRRYPELRLARGPPGVVAGMAIHGPSRTLYVADAGSGRVYAVKADSGVYARTARVEYPIFSSRLPAFEYSIYECLQVCQTAAGAETASSTSRSFGCLIEKPFQFCPPLRKHR